MTLTASVEAAAGEIENACVTFIDTLTGTVLAKGVRVAAVENSTSPTGTANAVVTLSSGRFGAQSYEIQVKLDTAAGSSYENAEQLEDLDSKAYATLTVMALGATNSMQGNADLDPAAPAGKYAAGTDVPYRIGLKYNKGGTNPQGQIQLILDLGDYRYYIKSNAISSIACSPPGASPCSDLTVYTKASIFRIDGLGQTTSVDGNVTLRIDAHDGGETGDDSIGFTVLASKKSTLYYSNRWIYSATSKSWRTVPQPVTATDGTAVVIN